MWWKNNKWKIIVPALIVVVLAAAFFSGGDIPEPTPAPSPVLSIPTPTPTAEPEVSPEPTPEPSADPEPSPAAEPEHSAEPSHTPEPPAEIDDDALTCTIYILCETILDNMDQCDSAKAGIIPHGGWILGNTDVEFEAGETVFDILLRVCKEKGIHMEYMDSPIYDSAYIEGIANIYEFDVGPLSGWMYKVNGWYPNYGCSRYALSDGDIIGWVYTCDLGEDVGGSNFRS